MCAMTTTTMCYEEHIGDEDGDDEVDDFNDDGVGDAGLQCS